jgi:PTS system fructose-specific IIC component
VLAFARSREGVDFGALDGERVYLFFLLASPEKHVGEHLKVLARISSFLRDKFVLELLKHAEDKKEILRIIASSEKALKQ